MPGKKVLMVTKVNAVWGKLHEFNEYWGRENLPFWEENGAKHIGSYVNYVGGSKSQIIRLFEFEDLSHWDRFMQFREEMFDSPKGRDTMKRLLTYIESIEETVWTSVY